MNTRSMFFLVVCGGLALSTLLLPSSLPGQNTGSTPEPASELSPQLTALINDLSAQQTQLTANQAQIDQKLDQLAETIRQARIFAARGGKK